MLKFNFKLLRRDDVPIHMLAICVRSCDVDIFIFSWRATDVTRRPSRVKDWKRLEEDVKANHDVAVRSALTALRGADVGPRVHRRK